MEDLNPSRVLVNNWVADNNRFHLAQPPEWFLKDLWEFDCLLVIVPSRLRPVYLLARRRNLTLRAPILCRAQDQLMRDTRGSDGDLLASLGLLPVDSIIPRMGSTIYGTWSPSIIQGLRTRDIVAAGGADKYADQLDHADHLFSAYRRQSLIDDIEHRAVDGYHSFQARTGQRSKLTIPSVQKKSSSSTAGSGIIITG